MPRKWMIAAIAAACALMAVGTYLGEPGQLLMHAASLCLACMGLG